MEGERMEIGEEGKGGSEMGGEDLKGGNRWDGDGRRPY